MVRSLFYVVILLLLYFIIQFIFFPTPPKLLAKQICIAPSGCSIEIDTGFCPKCIEVKEEPPIIKEEKVVVEEKPIVKIPQKKTPSQLEVSKTNKKKGVCYVEPCDWLDDSIERDGFQEDAEITSATTEGGKFYFLINDVVMTNPQDTDKQDLLFSIERVEVEEDE